MEEKITIGSVVTLKGMGQIMTIVDKNGDYFQCAHYNHIEGNLKYYRAHVDSLTIAK